MNRDVAVRKFEKQPQYDDDDGCLEEALHANPCPSGSEEEADNGVPKAAGE